MHVLLLLVALTSAPAHAGSDVATLEVSPSMAGVLTALRTAIEAEDWQAVADLFDDEHERMQHDLYFEEEGGAKAAAKRGKQKKFVRWYVREALGLSYVDNNARLEQIAHVVVDRVEAPQGDTLATVRLTFTLKDGSTRSGWVFLDLDTLRLGSSVG